MTWKINQNNDIMIQENQIEQDEIIEVKRSSQKNMVGDIFKIHLNEPVHELSNEFCKYYYASNIEDDGEFLAIVYENAFIHPIATIDKLYQKNLPHLNIIHEYSIVELSSTGSENLVVIIDSYDPKSNLELYVAENSSISLNMAEDIISQISQLLKSLHDAGIYYANICPKNIIIKDNKMLFVKEFINSIPLYYQPNAYLAPELINCHPAAREHSSVKVDTYALGMTIYASYIGKHPWIDFKTDKDYDSIRLENTTFKYLLNRTKLSEKFRAFFKGTLHDDILVRWSPDHLIDWCNGKHNNINKHESLTEKNNQINFDEDNYSNLKSLSNAFYHNWDKALRFIKDDKLYKWASREQINNDVLEGIKDVVDLKAANVVAPNNLNTHNKLTRLFSFIDPAGGIRIMNLALSPTSIPRFLQYLFTRMKKTEYEKLINVIKDQLWEQYTTKNSIGYLEEKLQNQFSNATKNIILGSSSKGVERLIYSLNSNSRCMSKMLDKYYATNLRELIISLDKYAATNPKKFILDRHVIGFVSAKLGLNDDIKPTIFSHFPKLVDHPAITTLNVMNVLQQHEPELKIPNICRAITHGLRELLEDNLHNIHFKDEIIKKLEKASQNGDLSNIIKTLSNQQQFINDYNGYYEACRKVKMIEDKIFNLNNTDSTFNTSLLLGQKVAVLTSYILCFIVTVTVIF